VTILASSSFQFGERRRSVTFAFDFVGRLANGHTRLHRHGMASQAQETTLDGFTSLTFAQETPRDAGSSRRLLGDAGYLSPRRAAYRAGHLTRTEWLDLVALHSAVIRAIEKPDEAAVIRELETMAAPSPPLQLTLELETTAEPPTHVQLTLDLDSPHERR
jgi:hypothetical protein